MPDVSGGDERHERQPVILPFDEGRYLRIQSGAVALGPSIREVVARAVRDGLDDVLFLGTGGAGILMQPAAMLLQRRSALHATWDMPAELLVNGSRHLGEHTLVVIPSLSGTTRESLDVAEFCKKRGATVMALTGDGNSPLARTADVSFENSAADDTSSESFYIQSLLVSLAVMDARSELDDYERLVEEFAALPSVLVRAKREFEGKAAQIACHITNTSWHIFTGAGSSWPEVHYFAMCILEEMQWIRTRPVHAADFFHGTLELVEAGISVVATMGEDPSRGLVERVEQFVRQFSDQLVVVDAAAIAKGELSARLRSLVSPVLLAAVLERVAAHVEAITEHPLVTRRYYRQMDY